MRLSAFFYKERKKERKRKGKERKIVFRVYNPKIFIASLLKLLFFIKKGRVSLSLLFLITHTHHPSEKRRAVLGEKRERTERERPQIKRRLFSFVSSLFVLKQTGEESRVFNVSSSSLF